ncbi:hypothetical protein BHM03_00025175 [Ensete ventricosum]|nr:hypothetical protein BHM03_00025175 [Ensete ventricosum]
MSCFMDAPRNFNVTTALRCNHRIAKDDEASLCLITAQYPRGALVSSPQVISTAKGASKPSPYGHRDLTGFGILNAHPPPPPPLPPSQAPPQRSFLESLTPLCLLFSPFSLYPSLSWSLSRRSFSCSLPPFL